MADAPAWPEEPPEWPAAPPPNTADGFRPRPSPLLAVDSGGGEGTPPGSPRQGQNRTLAIVAAIVVAVLVVGGVVTVLVVRNGGSNDVNGAKTAAGAKDVSLLGGRLIVSARPGWEALDSSDSTGTMRLEMGTAVTGRDLLATLIVVSLPAAGSLDTTLKVDGGTGFEVKASDGPIRATAVPGVSARVVAGAVRPKGTFFFTLSLSAMDAKVLDVAFLKKLFTDQIVPTLRFP